MLSNFQWYRRLRGGRWGRVSGWFWGKSWLRVTDACVEDCEEDWRGNGTMNKDQTTRAIVRRVIDGLIAKRRFGHAWEGMSQEEKEQTRRELVTLVGLELHATAEEPPEQPPLDFLN